MLQMVGRLLIVELFLLRMVDMMGGGLLVGLLLLVGAGCGSGCWWVDC